MWEGKTRKAVNFRMNSAYSEIKDKPMKNGPRVGFKKGNPGKPVGAKNKTTLLKEKLLEAALKIDLEGGRKIFSKKGKILVIPNVSATDIMKLAAGFVPRESIVRGEGIGTNVTINNSLSSEDIDPRARTQIIEYLRKKSSNG